MEMWWPSMGYGRISAQPLRLADPWARTNPHPFRRCNSPAAAGLPWNAMECHGMPWNAMDGWAWILQLTKLMFLGTWNIWNIGNLMKSEPTAGCWWLLRLRHIRPGQRPKTSGVWCHQCPKWPTMKQTKVYHLLRLKTSAVVGKTFGESSIISGQNS